MNLSQRSPQKAQRPCTTPQRLKMIESIKKSIHRSIQKINPAEYKNILKGEYIFMHLCHKGQIINSEYTKVALFMGAVVLKKAVEKVTVVVTNQVANKFVRKLVLMGKPVLSVLWLEACFQEKRKVPYQDFLFQNDKQSANQQQKSQQNSVNLDPLINLYKSNLPQLTTQFQKKYPQKFLRFLDKKQKPPRSKQPQPPFSSSHCFSQITLIPAHQIDIGTLQPQKRKSQIITDRNNKKKNQKRKVQIKSEGNQKLERENQNKLSTVVSMREEDRGDSAEEEVQNKAKMYNLGSKGDKEKNKNIYEKYLKDFKSYESKVKSIPIQQIPIKTQQQDTPFFIQTPTQPNPNPQTSTPQKLPDPNPKFTESPFQPTHSLKKPLPKTIKLNIIHPMISEKIEQINMKRQEQGLTLFQITGNDARNMICVISQESKVEAILALLCKPKIIVNQNFVGEIQREPGQEVTEEMLKKYEVRCKLNINLIQGKKIVLLDSVMGNSSLTNIIKKCNAISIGVGQFLFDKNKIDYVITNKKMYMRSEKDQYRVLSQANFIDQLIQFERNVR